MAAFPNGYALLIGVDESTVRTWALPDVAKDIAALESVLKDPDRCGYQTSNIKVLKGAAATYQGIVDALEWLQQRISADASDDATVFLDYSGHGWRDTDQSPPEYFLIPFDVKEDDIRSTALPAKTFAGAVSKLRPKRLFVILDCCHAAGMDTKGFGPAGFTSAALPPDVLMAGTDGVGPSGGAKGLETLSAGSGRAVLSSSQGTQQSFIRKDRKMSVFTYHLYEALTGHAGVSDAREVLVSDVMSHVWRRVPESVMRDYGEQQNPDYQVSGNFPLALLLGGKGAPKGIPPPEPIEDLRSRSISIQAGGDVITVGDISGATAIAVGSNAQATVNPPPPEKLRDDHS